MSHLGQHVIGIYFGRGMRSDFDLTRKKIGGDLALRVPTDLVWIIYALYRVEPNLVGSHLKIPAFDRYAHCSVPISSCHLCVQRNSTLISA